MMKFFLSKFPFSLFGVSVLGVWSTFYSDFFGLWLIISMIIILFFVVYAFKDFYRIIQGKSVPMTEKKEGRSIKKYTNAAPISLILLSMASLLGALNLLSYGERFGLWCVIPAIVDLILIVLAFRKFYVVSVDKDSDI